MNILKSIIKKLSYCVYFVIVCSFIFFSIIEIAPGLLKKINLDAIEYYAYKKRYTYDEKLVFRVKDLKEINTIYNGDLYRRKYGVKPLRLPYTASYSDDQFRTNSSSPPYNVYFIGDSYLDIGENDSSTFSELFKAISGRSTFNAGRSWYGPYQYVELFTHVIKKHPSPRNKKSKYAIFCFFSGNDIRDIKEYDRWLSGKSYYDYLPQQNFFERYIAAMSDMLGALLRELPGKTNSVVSRDSKRHLGTIKLADEKILMRFAYWNEKNTTEKLLQNREWKELKELLKQFSGIANKNDFRPVVLYIPSKLQVYGNLYINNESGDKFVEKVEEQLKYERNASEALKSITAELGISLVDLYCYFKELAHNGELLYYPFDTHWNINGRKHAAKYLYENMGITP